MMARTQISLDRELQRRARQRATELGVSLAEYVRGLVSRDLKRGKRRADISTIFGLGSSGGADIARDKDVMIGESIAADRRRRGRK